MLDLYWTVQSQSLALRPPLADDNCCDVQSHAADSNELLSVVAVYVHLHGAQDWHDEMQGAMHHAELNDLRQAVHSAELGPFQLHWEE